ncbi:hypothetical protein [Mycolicibacterium frederiksbergense]|uniref:hypothetical protein n=1 Tax=Mycolicibacterium frederiksbergense TaxID=117567 RepID=UPI002476A1B0|nr:hypothetical protein [Mycolicibacterium frederiksbergense]
MQLSAAIDPLDAWVKLFTNTGVNVTTLGEQILADPAPILTQMLHNGAGYAQTVATIVQGMGNGAVQWVKDLPLFIDMTKDALAEGRIDNALIAALVYVPGGLAMNLMMPLMSLSQISVGITENLYNVAKTIANPMTLFGTVLGSVQILSSTVGALGVGLQSFVDAVKAGDAVGAVNALVATPALVLNGLLNGNGNTPGIFTPDKPLSSGMPGPIAGVLVQVRRAIAQAIGAPAPSVARMAGQPAAGDTLLADGPAAVDALPSATVNTVTLNLSTDTVVKHAVTEAAVEKAPVVEAPVEKAPVVEAPAEKAPVVEAPADTVTEKTDSVVQISPKVTVGKVGTTKANTELKQAADTVGKQLNSTVKKVSDGLKNGFGKTSKKTADSGAGASSAGGAGGAGASSSGSSE